MKLSLNKSALALSFLDGTTTINANNFLWEKFEIELTEPLTNRESLWITFSSDTSGDISKDALLSEDGLTASLSTEAFTEITKIAGTWKVQAFIRVYSTTVDGAYVQAPTNTVEFTVSDGLSVWGDAPPTNETIVNLYEQAKTATEKVEEVLAAAESSAENAEKAATSAAEAATSKENAKTSEDNAKASEETAKKSANSAESSAAEAADSEKNAKTSEDNAKTSEENAATAAAEAEKALQKITNVYRYCGSVDKYTDLPTDADAGDVYNVETAYVDKDGKEYSAGTNYAWNGERWDPLGGNLSDKLDKVTTTDIYKRAYIIKGDGSQNTLKLSPNVQGGFLVMRGENGEVFVPTAPNADSCATSKKYVDTVAETAVKTAVKQAVTLDGDQTISGAKTFENVQVDGALLLPNSPTSPEEVPVEETFSARETGGGVNTVVDGETVLVEKIAGSTQNCYSLVDFSSAKSVDGVTVTANNNTLTISGTPTAAYRVIFRADISDLLKDGKTYTMWQSVAFSSAAASGAVYMHVNLNASDGTTNSYVYSATNSSGKVSFVCDKTTSPQYIVHIMAGAALDTINSTISFMLYEGTDEKPYQPYFKGLKNAYFEKVVSTGRSLIDFSTAKKSTGGLTVTADNNTLTISGTPTYNNVVLYREDITDLLEDGGSYSLCQSEIQKRAYHQLVRTNIRTGEKRYANSATTGYFTFVVDKSTYTYTIEIVTSTVENSGTFDNFECSFMFYKGTTILPYEPYTESELGFSSSPDLAVVEEVAHVNDSSEIAEEAAQYNNSVIYLSDMSNVHVGMLVDFYMDGTIISGATARQIMFLDTEAKYIVIDGADPMENVPIDTTVRRSAQVKLPEWDYILPQEQKIVRQTGRVEFTGTESWALNTSDETSAQFIYKLPQGAGDRLPICNSFVGANADDNAVEKCFITIDLSTFVVRTSKALTVDEWKAYLAEQYAAGDPVIVEYKLAEATEEDIVIPNNYTAYQGGLEKVVQGNTDNSEYGAENTVTSTYKIVENPNEAACKAYVQNGLAKKLDKTGGVITGSLIVEGGMKTSLKGFVSRSEEGTFGMVYDLSSKAFMLGFGEVDEDGNFSFSEGEGLPVTLREDSSAFEDGTVVQWSSDGNKLVPTDLRVEDIATLKELAEVEAQIPTDANLKDYARLDGDNDFTGNNTLNGTATTAKTLTTTDSEVVSVALGGANDIQFQKTAKVLRYDTVSERTETDGTVTSRIFRIEIFNAEDDPIEVEPGTVIFFATPADEDYQEVKVQSVSESTGENGGKLHTIEVPATPNSFSFRLMLGATITVGFSLKATRASKTSMVVGEPNSMIEFNLDSESTISSFDFSLFGSSCLYFVELICSMGSYMTKWARDGIFFYDGTLSHVHIIDLGDIFVKITNNAKATLLYAKDETELTPQSGVLRFIKIGDLSERMIE